jgi:putative oxidoreductase
MRAFQRRMMQAGWASLPLRLMLGFGFAAHGAAKLARGPEAFGAILAAIGVPLPVPTAWATAWLELLGGIGLGVGLGVEPLGAALAVVMLTAMFTVHWGNGFSSIKLEAVTAEGARFGQPGYEVNLLYVAGLLTIGLGGAGPLSLDSWLRRWSERSRGTAGSPRG